MADVYETLPIIDRLLGKILDAFDTYSKDMNTRNLINDKDKKDYKDELTKYINDLFKAHKLKDAGIVLTAENPTTSTNAARFSDAQTDQLNDLKKTYLQSGGKRKTRRRRRNKRRTNKKV